jgi:flagellar basal body-associated protein FliL
VNTPSFSPQPKGQQPMSIVTILIIVVIVLLVLALLGRGRF